MPTGTEWEFEDALEFLQEKGTPDLLVYRKVAQSSILADNIETVKEWVSQKEALDTFLDKWFRDHEGAFKAAFNSFNNEEEFEKLLTTHLEKNVSLRLTSLSPSSGPKVRRSEDWIYSISITRKFSLAETWLLPRYPSLAGAIFARARVPDCVGHERLRQVIAGTRGVLAELMRPGVVEDVGCWRWAVMRPSEASGTLTECPWHRCYSEKGSPELADLGYDQKKFAALLQDAPTQRSHWLRPL